MMEEVKMKTINDVKNFLKQSKTRDLFAALYGNVPSEIERQVARYESLAKLFFEHFGEKEVSLFSSPGRTEIGGNHTDHNLGKVLTGSINLDAACVASKNDDNKVRIYDLKYNEDFTIDINNLQRAPSDRGSYALVKGLLKGFAELGGKIGGFDACISSEVIAAAGVSSSACFEMLICAILNSFYNDNKVDKVIHARAGQYAENKYWDKASGLLDQTACAFGGMVAIDFENPTAPKVEEIAFDFSKQGYDLLIVNTGGSHANLSPEYSSIPNEMKQVAAFFGKQHCREITKEMIFGNLPKLREATGDRAILRALHFLAENERVDAQVAALKENNFNAFLEKITESGNSSWKWLQNCYVNEVPNEQGITLMLSLTELFLANHKGGACRVHGGGFAGVIAVYLPTQLTKEYTDYIEGIVNEKVVYKMFIRPFGAINICETIEQ